MDENQYYGELQETLRSYDAKIWQIPGLFFTALGIVTTNLNYSDILTLRNGVLSLVAGVGFFILLLFQIKANIFHISVQKKIDEYDCKYNAEKDTLRRFPLGSMTKLELRRRIYELETGRFDTSFTWTQKILAEVSISKTVRRTMITFTVAALLFGLTCAFTSFISFFSTPNF